MDHVVGEEVLRGIVVDPRWMWIAGMRGVDRTDPRHRKFFRVERSCNNLFKVYELDSKREQLAADDWLIPDIYDCATQACIESMLQSWWNSRCHVHLTCVNEYAGHDITTRVTITRVDDSRTLFTMSGFRDVVLITTLALCRDKHNMQDS